MQFVEAFEEQFPAEDFDLVLLVNNAGIMAPPFFRTVDGLEGQMATNHLGPFLLTLLLLPRLRRCPPARVVVVSSIAHALPRRLRGSDLDRDYSNERIGAFVAYGRSYIDAGGAGRGGGVGGRKGRRG